MTETNPAGFLQNAGATHTAAQLRTYMGGLLAGSFTAGGVGTRTRPGIHNTLGNQMSVTANGTPNMSVNVAPGLAFIAGTESSFQGMYFCHNDGTVNLSIATAPGTGLNRIDLVVAQVLDQFYSGASNQWKLAVITGTAASSPSPPTAPNSSLVLAQVFVGANVSSITSGNITDMRQWATGLGGIVKCTSSTHPQNLGIGDVIWESDTNRFYYWNGSQWYWPLPRGIVGGTRYTGSGNLALGVGSTELAINMQTGNVNLEANRTFKITACFKVSVTAANTTLVMHVRDTNIAGTQININAFTIPSTSFGYNPQMSDAYYETSGSVTKNFILSCDAHGGFATFSGGSTTNVPFVAIEDVGPSGIMTIQSSP